MGLTKKVELMQQQQVIKVILAWYILYSLIREWVLYS